jgi:deoxyribodipyrimidine photo-lyase
MTDAAGSSTSLCPPRCAVAVPSLGAEETTAAADEAFRRHTSPGLRRGSGAGGVAVVWFRNDLRVLDNEALARAWAASEAVLPVYCVDPRVLGGATHRFGFPKTGGERPAPAAFGGWRLARSTPISRP